MDKIEFSRLLGLLCFAGSIVTAATVPPEWEYAQTVQVVSPGLTQLPLSMETRSVAQPELGDLRLVDAAGRETAFFVHQPVQEYARQLALSGLKISMAKGKTVIEGRVPQPFLQDGFDALYLYSPTADFLKALTVETSPDGRRWTPLLKNRPVFRQPGQGVGAEVEFPRTRAPWLRVALDDVSTPPIRVQTVTLYSAPKKPANLEAVRLSAMETWNDAHRTDVHLTLPARNLLVQSIEIATQEATFRRPVTVGARVFANGEFRETGLGQGLIHRIELDRQRSEKLSIPLDRQIPGRELVLHIDNGDSRPLEIEGVTLRVIPASLIFQGEPGFYSLWSGNPQAAPRRYDVAAFREVLAHAEMLPRAAAGPLARNAAYQTPAPLPEVAEEGAEIDVSAWPFRKPVTLSAPGLQRLELDPECLAQGRGRPESLRLVRDGKQLPYVLDRASLSREMTLALVPLPGKGSVSQWKINLPLAGLPIRTIRFSVPEPLFKRSMTLYEETLDERGDSVRIPLGSAEWVRSNGLNRGDFFLTLYRQPRTNALQLEADNGDNPAIHLLTATGYYEAPRLLFKASPGKELWLYYGQPEVAAPVYDLNLIAGVIASLPPTEAKLGPEEILKVRRWWEAPAPAGAWRYAFWAIMGLVVAGLLVVIAKLLPPENKED